MSEEKRKWVATELTEDTHRMLYLYATEIGEHPSKILERFTIDGLKNAAAEAKDPSIYMRTFLAVQSALQREQTRSQLERLAWSAMDQADQKTFDDLADLCQGHGMTLEEVLEAVVSQKTPPVLIQDNGHGIGSAARWLEAMFRDRPEYPASDIVARGKEAGFSPPTLNAAKRKVGLISVRRAKYWSWVMPGHELDPQLEQAPDEEQPIEAPSFEGEPDPF